MTASCHDGRAQAILPFQARPRLARAVASIIGVFFVVAAMSKAYDPSGIVNVLQFMGWHAALIAPLLWGLVLFELLLGQALVFGWGHRWTTILAIIVLGGFSVLLGYLALFDTAPPCGCLSLKQTYSSARISNILGVTRNVLLIGSLAILWWPTRR